MLVERFIVRRESFVGLTCTWWNSRDGHGRIFNCSTSTTTSIRIPHDKVFQSDDSTPEIAQKLQNIKRQILQSDLFQVLEASIQIPASLFHQLELRGKPSNSHQIMVSIYDNAKLFPTLFNVNRTVSSPIVGAKLGELNIFNTLQRRARIFFQDLPKFLQKLQTFSVCCSRSGSARSGGACLRYAGWSSPGYRSRVVGRSSGRLGGTSVPAVSPPGRPSRHQVPPSWILRAHLGPPLGTSTRVSLHLYSSS